MEKDGGEDVRPIRDRKRRDGNLGWWSWCLDGFPSSGERTELKKGRMEEEEGGWRKGSGEWQQHRELIGDQGTGRKVEVKARARHGALDRRLQQIAQDGKGSEAKLGIEVERTDWTKNSGFGSDQAQDGSVSDDNREEEEGCARPQSGGVRHGGEKLVGARRRGNGSGTNGRKWLWLRMTVAEDRNWEEPPELCLALSILGDDCHGCH